MTMAKSGGDVRLRLADLTSRKIGWRCRFDRSTNVVVDDGELADARRRQRRDRPAADAAGTDDGDARCLEACSAQPHRPAAGRCARA